MHQQSSPIASLTCTRFLFAKTFSNLPILSTSWQRSASCTDKVEAVRRPNAWYYLHWASKSTLLNLLIIFSFSIEKIVSSFPSLFCNLSPHTSLHFDYPFSHFCIQLICFFSTIFTHNQIFLIQAFLKISTKWLVKTVNTTVLPAAAWSHPTFT